MYSVIGRILFKVMFFFFFKSSIIIQKNIYIYSNYFQCLDTTSNHKQPFIKNIQHTGEKEPLDRCG